MLSTASCIVISTKGYFFASKVFTVIQCFSRSFDRYPSQACAMFQRFGILLADPHLSISPPALRQYVDLDDLAVDFLGTWTLLDMNIDSNLRK